MVGFIVCWFACSVIATVIGVRQSLNAFSDLNLADVLVILAVASLGPIGIGIFVSVGFLTWAENITLYRQPPQIRRDLLAYLNTLTDDDLRAMLATMELTDAKNSLKNLL